MKKFLFLLFLFFSTLCFSTTYYIDYIGGDDSDAGTSPATAWQHLPWDSEADGSSAAKSGNLNPGDILALKPDTTYNGHDIEVNDDGTGDLDSQRIILTGSPTDWGSGTNNAEMTGTPSGTWEGLIEIYQGTNQYITIKEITIRDLTIGCAIGIAPSTGETANYIKLINLLINNCDGFTGLFVDETGGGSTDNLTIDSIEVKNCAGTGFRIDCCGDNLLIKNSIFHDNGSGGGNDDGLFVGNTEDYIVQDCVAYNNGGGASSGSGFDTSTDTSHTSTHVDGGIFQRCYSYSNDNVGFSCSSNYSGDVITYRNCISYDNPGWGNFTAYEDVTMHIYNCTSGGSEGGSPGYNWTGYDGNQDGEIYNSIAYGSYNYAIYFNGTGTLLSDYNCFNDGNSNLAYYKGSPYNWSGWQGLGFDEHGNNSNPQFVGTPALPDDDYYKLQSTSPCRNTGTNLSGEGFSDDYDSVSRPQESYWDIGAYEYTANGGSGCCC